MKAKLATVAAFVFAAIRLPAVPLTEAVSVYLKPESSGAALAHLKSGEEPKLATGTTAPDGWVAVELEGPYEVYVHNKTLTKKLDAQPGTPYHLQPSDSSPSISTAEAGDSVEIVGMYGPKKQWAKLQLSKKIIGYYKASAAPKISSAETAPVSETKTAVPTPPAAAPTPVVATPARPFPSTPAPAAPIYEPARPSPTTAGNDSGSGALPRVLQGTVVLSKGFLGAKKPYPFQLVDSNGARLAYMNLAKLLLTEQPEKYIGRDVEVFGVIHALPEGKGLVIDAESLQLR